VLLCIGASDKIQVVTDVTGTIDVHASYVDFDPAQGLPENRVIPGRKNTAVTTNGTYDVVASPGAGLSRNVKTLNISNKHATTTVVVTVQHTDGTTVAEIDKIALGPGERMSRVEGVGLRVFDAAGREKVLQQQLVGQSIATRLTADVSNSTTTAAKITGLDVALSPGTYVFEYYLNVQAAATTTGIKLGCNFSGTVTTFMYDLFFATADTTATATQTANADQDVLTATAGLFEVLAARAKTTTAPMITAGVDTINADTLYRITGLMVVTVAGNLELYHASEVAAASTVKAGSSLVVSKTA
jgi:hypothetical protein